MSYIVSARKYRPQQFDEVVGQSHVSSTLQKALDSDQIAHAFLFCGPRGVGKTSCARIMAKVLNCENKPNAHTACNECGSCKSFNDNASFNIIELDAASNNSVENIRTLIEQVRFQPQQGKYKIFIIDEVHMLSTSAFNAFLKTLEEPPSYAIFILATTEKHKIIPTILSRCQVFDFKRIQVGDMVEQLKHIAEQENRTYELEALHTISEKADGAMRDALSIFDRIASTGDAITYKQVVENLNILDYETYFKIVDALMLEDISSLLIQFNDITRRGFDADHFMNGLANHFRNLLVAKDASTFPLMELSDNLKNKYIQQAQLISADFILTAMNIANQCDINFPKAKNKILHTEIALAKMAKINRVMDLGSVAVAEKKTEVRSANKAAPKESYTKKLEAEVDPESEAEADANTETGIRTNLKGNSVIDGGENTDSSEEKEKPSKSISVPKKENEYKKNLPKLNSLEALVKQVAEEEAKNAKAGEPFTTENLTRVWNEYLENIESQAISSSLRNTVLACGDDTILVYVPSQIAKETIIQETSLIQKIRQNFNKPEIPLEVIVDIHKFPDFKAPEKPKLLGPREKYELLVETNPLISELTKRFDLTPDTE